MQIVPQVCIQYLSIHFFLHRKLSQPKVTPVEKLHFMFPCINITHLISVTPALVQPLEAFSDLLIDCPCRRRLTPNELPHLAGQVETYKLIKQTQNQPSNLCAEC